MIGILAGELFDVENIEKNCRIKGITCDSRRIKPGYVFVCLYGEHDSGYLHIREAEARGAAVIIADRVIDSHIPVILSHNPRRKMAEYAKKIYSAADEKMHTIGVTGTNGKTSVTHLLRDILCEEGRKTALIGTNGCYYNFHQTDESFTTSTTPEAPELWNILKNMYELGAKNAVMEVSSHALELDRVYGMNFDIGVFTNLTQDHLDFHKNIENYFKSKEKLFYSAKKCVINTDDEYGKRLYEQFGDKSVSVGFKNADITASEISYTAEKTEFYINDGKIKTNIILPIPGRFSVYNALCAYTAARLSEINPETIKSALEKTTGVRGRAERIDTGKDFNVIIDYAHTPDGLRNIIGAIRQICRGRVITLFGCGGNRDSQKRCEMGKISGELSDFTVITSDNPRFENPDKILEDIEKGIEEVCDRYVVIKNRFDAIGYAMKYAKKDDYIILAGKGHEDYITENGRKTHFDEREAVKYWTEQIS